MKRMTTSLILEIFCKVRFHVNVLVEYTVLKSDTVDAKLKFSFLR